MEIQEADLIYSFPRTRDEVIQFFVSKYKGKHYVDIRLWYQPKDNSPLRPTKKGVSFFLDQARQLQIAADKLVKAANEVPEDEENLPKKAFTAKSQAAKIPQHLSQNGVIHE